MKKRLILFILFSGLLAANLVFAEETPPEMPCPFGSCTQRWLRNMDDSGNGTLRAAVADACRQEGDDRLDFGSGGTIFLKTPIVVPADCNGRIAVFGGTNGEIVIDGSRTEKSKDDRWGSCLLRVESDSHIIDNLRFVGFNSGTKANLDKLTPGIGLCLIGNDNEVRNSDFGLVPFQNQPGNDIGVFISGKGNRLLNDHLSNNFLDGLVISGDDNRIQGNIIGELNPQCGPPRFHASSSALLSNRQTAKLPPVKFSPVKSSPVKLSRYEMSAVSLKDIFQGRSPWKAYVSAVQFLSGTGDKKCQHLGNGRDGIRLLGKASGNLIGWNADFEEKSAANFIEFNGANGVSQIGTADSTGNRISRNVISRNGSLGIDLTLLQTPADDLTPALASDGITPNDEGDIDAGPNDLLNYPDQMVVHLGEQGAAKSYIYGKAPLGTTLEIYLNYGAGAESDERQGWEFIQSAEVGQDPFFLVELPSNIPLESRLTILAIDAAGNTSEFSEGIFLEKDSDLDGIPDFVEDQNNNGFVDEEETDSFSADSDDDGLMDSVEDRNKNGLWDEGEHETKGFKADSDDDGISDYIEIKTNPLLKDTDCNGHEDGQEDLNRNGIFETSLGESDPRKTPDEPGCAP